MTPLDAGVALFSPTAVHREDRPGRVVLLRSKLDLQPTPTSLADVFHAGAQVHPDRVLIGQRDGAGWRQLTWGEAHDRVQALAQGMIDRGLARLPVMVLSGNSIEHFLLMLACYTVGSPIVPISVAYSLQSEDHDKIRRIASLVLPGMVFAEDGEAYGAALRAVVEVSGATRVVTLHGGEGMVAFSALHADRSTDQVHRLRTMVTGQTVAKLLFTSGSTGEPKAVTTTHRMLSANQQAMTQVWPFLAEHPPVLLDWLPWSHTFGGNHNTGMVLFNGGTLYVDDGRPAPGLLDRTLRNLADVSPTVFFNVPLGYLMLVPRLREDPELAARFFRELRVIFFAAAALPQHTWESLIELAGRYASHPVAVTTSWGATETAPAATSAHFRSDRADCIGVPLPGVELKLVPTGDKREIRVRGPHVTPGYYGRPDLTATAFDEEGYYRTGDAVDLIDADVPEAGLRFAGRIAEDFKLESGTWVNVAAVKGALLSSCGGVLQDCVIAGHDRARVTAMAWLNPSAASHLVPGYRLADGLDPLLDHPAVREYLAESLRTMNEGAGSSRRVERLLLLDLPARLDAGEITDKGYVNQRRTLDLRAAQVEQLYAGSPGPRVIEVEVS
jgi:feruloyl-CoA synthase